MSDLESQEHDLLEPRPKEEWGHSPGCPVCNPRDEADENDLAKKDGLCRATVIYGDTEFICINKVHMDEKDRHRSSQPNQYGYYPQSERHYFVNRWPNRPRSEQRRMEDGCRP